MSMIKPNEFSKAQKIIVGGILFFFLVVAFFIVKELQQQAQLAKVLAEQAQKAEGEAEAEEGAVEEHHALMRIDKSKFRDPKVREKGKEVYFTICINCHSLELVRYKDTNSPVVATPYASLMNTILEDNFTEKIDREKLSNIQAAYTFAKAAGERQMKTSYGKVPPDLSLMTKARGGGPDYLYSFLNGFEENKECAAPTNGNKYMHGAPCTAMPASVVANMTDEDKQAIVAYLYNKAEPFEEQRLFLGKFVVIFLFALAYFTWLLKREIWKPIKSKKKKRSIHQMIEEAERAVHLKGPATEQAESEGKNSPAS